MEITFNFILKSFDEFQVFIRHFTLGLQTELAPYGISVQLLTPFCVQTKLHTYPVNVIIGNIFFPRVEIFAKWAVYTLGKTTETTGYWAHAIMVQYKQQIREISLIYFRSFSYYFNRELNQNVDFCFHFRMVQ